MRFKTLFLTLARLFRPDKSLYSDIAEDLRKMGTMSIGAGIAGFLLQSNKTALLLLTFGCIIWVLGLYVASKAKADDTKA